MSSPHNLDQNRAAPHPDDAVMPGKSLALQEVRVTPSTVRSGDALEMEFQFRAQDRGQLRECAILIYSADGIRIAISDMRPSKPGEK